MSDVNAERRAELWRAKARAAQRLATKIGRQYVLLTIRYDALEDALLRMQARAAVMEDTLRENGPWDDADSRITDEVHEQARAALALARGE